MKQDDFTQFWKENGENFQGLVKVIDSLKTQIDDDMKVYDDDEPFMQITISNNEACTTWSFQSGDNSYAGSCYGDPYWGVGYIYKNSDSKDVAKTLINDLAENTDFID